MKTHRSILVWSPLLLAVLLSLGCRALTAANASSPKSASVAVPMAPAIDASHVASRLVDAIIQVESGANPRKVGRHGERGLMQIKADTWHDMTVRLFGAPLSFDQAFDPALNRRVGTAYLAFLQEQILARQTEWKSDERSLLLAAYNAGPSRLRTSGYQLARMPRSTRDYVERASALHDAYLDDVADAVRQRLLAAL